LPRRRVSACVESLLRFVESRLRACGLGLPACGFELPACGFGLLARGFGLLARGFGLPACGFELPACGFGLLARGFELSACGFALPGRGFESSACGFVSRLFCGFDLYGRIRGFRRQGRKNRPLGVRFPRFLRAGRRSWRLGWFHSASVPAPSGPPLRRSRCVLGMVGVSLAVRGGGWKRLRRRVGWSWLRRR